LRKRSFFGQYNFSDSLLCKLDPRVKIVLVFSIVVFLFFVKTISGYILLLLFSIFLILLAKSKISDVFRSLAPILFLLLFTVLFQLFFTPGKVVYSFFFLKVTSEGIYLATYIAMRLMLLSFFTFVLTATTSNIELTDGFEAVISPLKIVRFPTEDVALMISIAMRFVPVLFEEATRIMKAQTSRGVLFNKGSLMQRARSFLPLLLPLLLNAFNRADQLAIAMEARGFVVGKARTKYREMQIKKIDLFFIFLFILIMAASIMVKRI